MSEYLDRALERAALPISVSWDEDAGEAGLFFLFIAAPLWGSSPRFRATPDAATRAYLALVNSLTESAETSPSAVTAVADLAFSPEEAL